MQQTRMYDYMNVFLRIDINIAAMALLGIVFIVAYHRLDRQDIMNKKFLSTSMIILLEVLFETITCMINGRPELWLIPVSVFMHIAVFITAPILTYSWYVFIHSWVAPQTVISKKKHIFLLIPVAFNAVITCLSPFYGWVFYINSSNLYHRGEFFIVSSVITYFYLLYSLALILKQRKKIIKQEFFPLFIFGILPIIGGLFQTLFYGVLLMWSCSAFSLSIVYIFLQQRMVHLDVLTGAWTRESFDGYVLQRMKQRIDIKFGAIYLDFDGLKQINDEFGHFEGDCAIKDTIQLIKSLLRKTDVVARLGGDEFIIIIDCESSEVLEKMVERISLQLSEYNEKSGKAYNLACSFGIDIFNSSFNSIEQFLRHLDTLMYSNKKKKKITS